MIVIESLDFTHFIDSIIGHTEGNFLTEIIQVRVNIEITDGRR